MAPPSKKFLWVVDDERGVEFPSMSTTMYEYTTEEPLLLLVHTSSLYFLYGMIRACVRVSGCGLVLLVPIITTVLITGGSTTEVL
jgi:hypothetical protein